MKKTIDNIINNKLVEEYMKACLAYTCKECSFFSTDKNECYQHCLRHVINKPSESPTVFLCSQCYQAFNSLDETKSHMREEHGKKGKAKYKMRKKEEGICPRRGCKASFKKLEDLQLHLRCHTSGDVKTLCCPECSLLLPSWPKCAMHLYKVHQLDCGLLKCLSCEAYRTWAPLALENHMRVHSDLRAFMCKICGHSFKQASQLRNHYITHTDNDTLPGRNKWKQCTMCFKVYSDSKTLKKHKVEVHSKLRPFVCNVCGHASARRSLLTLHQRQHTGHKVHSCSNCPYTTADHNSLRRHLMRHTGVRAYHCAECGFSTIRSSSYKQHVRLKHPDLPLFFTCQLCSYKTVSEDNYTRHVSDHLTGLVKEKSAEPVLNQLAQVFPAWLLETASSQNL